MKRTTITSSAFFAALINIYAQETITNMAAKIIEEIRNQYEVVSKVVYQKINLRKSVVSVSSAFYFQLNKYF